MYLNVSGTEADENSSAWITKGSFSFKFPLIICMNSIINNHKQSYAANKMFPHIPSQSHQLTKLPNSWRSIAPCLGLATSTVPLDLQKYWGPNISGGFFEVFTHLVKDEPWIYFFLGIADYELQIVSLFDLLGYSFWKSHQFRCSFWNYFWPKSPLFNDLWRK